MTRDDEARARRYRAQARMDSATHIRKSGSFMMIAGGVLLGMAVVAFASHNTPEIPSWIRQAILTVIAMLWLGGMAFYVAGQSLQRMLAQMADDRDGAEAQHDEQMTLLREIKRSHTFLVARLGAGDAVPLHEMVDPKYLADMSEAVRLGEELAKRKLKPPDQTPN